MDKRIKIGLFVAGGLGVVALGYFGIKYYTLYKASHTSMSEEDVIKLIDKKAKDLSDTPEDDPDFVPIGVNRGDDGSIQDTGDDNSENNSNDTDAVSINNIIYYYIPEYQMYISDEGYIYDDSEKIIDVNGRKINVDDSIVVRGKIDSDNRFYLV